AGPLHSCCWLWHRSVPEALLDQGVGRLSLVDASHNMLNVGSSKLATEIGQGRVLCLEHSRTPPLPFQNGSFDVVLMNMVRQ
ncbi:hypothetical protein MAR_007398, partial [Mya arenaria]